MTIPHTINGFITFLDFISIILLIFTYDFIYNYIKTHRNLIMTVYEFIVFAIFLFIGNFYIVWYEQNNHYLNLFIRYCTILCIWFSDIQYYWINFIKYS